MFFVVVGSIHLTTTKIAQTKEKFAEMCLPGTLLLETMVINQISSLIIVENNKIIYNYMYIINCEPGISQIVIF